MSEQPRTIADLDADQKVWIADSVDEQYQLRDKITEV